MFPISDSDCHDRPKKNRTFKSGGNVDLSACFSLDWTHTHIILSNGFGSSLSVWGDLIAFDRRRDREIDLTCVQRVKLDGWPSAVRLKRCKGGEFLLMMLSKGMARCYSFPSLPYHPSNQTKSFKAAFWLFCCLCILAGKLCR